jgi:hypothetical protein
VAEVLHIPEAVTGHREGKWSRYERNGFMGADSED